MEQDDRIKALELIEKRRDELLAKQTKLRQEREALAAQIRAIDRELADCVAAARVFGGKLALPEIDDQDGTGTAFHRALYALQKSERNQIFHFRTNEAPGDAVSRLVPDKSGDERSAPAMPKVKDIVLDRLKAAGSEGTKARPIQDYIVETYGEKIHDKTVGMTLYRLSQDGLAHRKGFVWFFGPPDAKTENPGAATPGSENTL